jgi:esterase/lipase superfamily enzyme
LSDINIMSGLELLPKAKAVRPDVPVIMLTANGDARLGEVDATQDPYRSEFAQDRIEVFDLTSLKKSGDNAHNRAFEDVTSVVGMIKQRLGTGQQINDSEPGLTNGL